MAESQFGRQLDAAVAAPLAEAATYLALITRANPLGSADDLLRRPDADAILREALDEGREAAMAYIEQAWLGAGADGLHPSYARLQADAARVFGSLAHLRGLVRRAYASVPHERFVPGVTEPGRNPAAEAADRRADAVSAAVRRWAFQAGRRVRMSLSAAEGLGRTAALLESARISEQAGERVRKRWARNPSSASCIWCRRLDGVTIAISASFAPYLGGPVALPQSGSRRVATPAGAARYKLPAGAPIILTHPPRLYHGDLQGPLLHPFCECRLEIVRHPGGLAVPSSGGREEPAGQQPISRAAGGFLAASDVRAMPEDQYQADLALLRAAVIELGRAMRGLAGGR